MDLSFECRVDFLIYSPNFSNVTINELENSNKIILNSNILTNLSKKLDKIESPMIFKLTNNTEFGLYEYFVGVHDFSAKENIIYLPNNIADELFVEKNSIINIQYYVPPKGSYIKLKPKTTKFYDILEVKSVLEQNIVNNYPVLQKNMTIRIKYFDTIVELLIEDCKPFDVISTNNTDLEVDFSPIKKKEIPVNKKDETIIDKYIPNIQENKDNNESDGLKLGGSELNAISSNNERVKAFIERRKLMELKRKNKYRKMKQNKQGEVFGGKGYKLTD